MTTTATPTVTIANVEYKVETLETALFLTGPTGKRYVAMRTQTPGEWVAVAYARRGKGLGRFVWSGE